MKTLIAFYSRKGANYVNGSIVDLPVGNTEVVAGLIQKLTGGDLFKIDTVTPYPADYTQATEVAQRELNENARPALTGRVEGMEAYDTVILGYPNWWGTMPMAVWTFLDSYDFRGKTLLPLCTHEGSGLGHSERDIQRLCPGAKVLKGLAIQGSQVRRAEKEIEAWLKRASLLA